jgi:hypothetical protein
MAVLHSFSVSRTFTDEGMKMADQGLHQLPLTRIGSAIERREDPGDEGLLDRALLGQDLFRGGTRRGRRRGEASRSVSLRRCRQLLVAASPLGGVPCRSAPR